MKFIILLFTILVNIKLYCSKLYELKNSLSGGHSEFKSPIFLEKKSFSKKSTSTKSMKKQRNKSYKMKITIIKDIDKESDAPLIVKGNVRLDKNFEVYSKEDTLTNSISFIK